MSQEKSKEFTKSDDYKDTTTADTVPASNEERTAESCSYAGSGTLHDPYIVDWDLADPENPYNWSKPRKWVITLQLGLSTWVAAFCSSAYTGGLGSMIKDLHTNEEVALLGVTLYVLGFGFGPLLFAPLGEVYGRRPVFLTTMSIFTLFHMGGALGRNIQTVLICRMFAGTFGSSPLTNSSGAISDIWTARERGVASALYATAPFMGPVLGPIVGGWIDETPLGWRFTFWVMMMCSAVITFHGFFLAPETYAPALLRKRARKLRKASGNQVHYVSKFDLTRSKSFADKMRTNLTRPFLFLVTEPIVLLMSLYIAITYAILYAFFAAFPIVFQQHRGFSTGEGGLAFLGVGIGILFGTSLAPVNNILYWRAMDRSETGRAPPEARLYMPMMGAFLLPIGLFWFAWTSQPSVHWIVPIIAGIPIGTGTAQVMQGLVQYIMDAYSIYCASAIASTVLLRSLLAAIFPLISPPMFKKLGDQWAISLFAFLATACMPLPLLFFKYGAWVRSKSKFARNDGVLNLEPVTPPTPLDPEQGRGFTQIEDEKTAT
ncbi:MFS transporter superfamily protein [Abortiporus biennis]